MPRTCIFCGKSGAITREHAWPDWLRVLNAPGASHILTSLQYGKLISERTALNPELIVRRVCDRCNNGWMAGLEKAVKPLLLKMMRGDPRVTLWRDQQPLVGKWAVKTAMVMEFTNTPPTEFYTAAERLAMAERQGIPPKTSVWLAVHNAELRRRVAAARTYDVTTAGGQTYAVWVDTLVLEHLVIQCVTHRSSDREPLLLPSEARETLVQIWPLPGDIVTWPPHRGVTDATLNSIIDLFGPVDEKRRPPGA